MSWNLDLAERSSHVLNVIAEEARVLAAQMSRFGQAEWLSYGHAFDIPILGSPTGVLAEARGIAGDRAVDINLLPVESRRKKLLIADMDSTIVTCECLDELAGAAGLKEKVSAITERAMRGELSFERALRKRVALLEGLPLEALARTYAERVRLNPGARALVTTMRAHGAHTLLVSGGFTYFTSRVAADAGFDANRGNRLLDDGLALTGEVGEPILGREAKLRALEDAVARLGISPADALAVGDGANDLDMIRQAGLGVAYHAKPIVAAAAGANISYGDLTALLYLQGYRKEEIVGS
jgi:phosphoserine phosphatase